MMCIKNRQKHGLKKIHAIKLLKNMGIGLMTIWHRHTLGMNICVRQCRFPKESGHWWHMSLESAETEDDTCYKTLKENKEGLISSVWNISYALGLKKMQYLENLNGLTGLVAETYLPFYTYWSVYSCQIWHLSRKGTVIKMFEIGKFWRPKLVKFVNKSGYV